MSNSPAIVSPTAWFRPSSKKGMAQPPWVNPFLGSSSGPPGACMTPSRVTCVIAMILLMVSLQFLGFVPQGRTTDASSYSSWKDHKGAPFAWPLSECQGLFVGAASDELGFHPVYARPADTERLDGCVARCGRELTRLAVRRQHRGRHG